MNGNFYENELHQTLRLEFESDSIREQGESSPFFVQLAQTYPVHGSKIDWGRIPGSIERVENNETSQIESFIAFFDEIMHRFSLSGDVVYIGDSITDFAIMGEIKSIRKALPQLLRIPQHHYLLGPKCSWCLCLTMEGDMAFAFKPRRELNEQTQC